MTEWTGTPSQRRREREFAAEHPEIVRSHVEAMIKTIEILSAPAGPVITTEGRPYKRAQIING